MVEAFDFNIYVKPTCVQQLEAPKFINGTHKIRIHDMQFCQR